MPIEWGRSFGSLQTTNLVDDGCKLNTGLPVCCGIFNTTPPAHAIRHLPSIECVTEKVYVPSPYEQMQMNKALYFDANITDFATRKRAVIDYITSERDLNDSFVWMTRVKRHMRDGGGTPPTTEEASIDNEYLSQFLITRKCPHQPIQSWVEWIEPLTIHARNPFTLLGCVKINHQELARRFPLYAPLIRTATILNGIYSTDHILLHADQRQSQHQQRAQQQHQQQRHPAMSHGGRNFFLDAGTSSFESSLWWFSCMYLQRNISFDAMYGWEHTLLEPAKFWAEVPAAMRAKYHFYNTKMSADPEDGNSPLRMIKQIATEHDFVSFKLDIDTPAVELPTVLHILKDKELHRLIGEFFFELHFRCEVMMYCGWGEGNVVPEELFGLKLHRWNVLNLFQELRRAGLRAHFWP